MQHKRTTFREARARTYAFRLMVGEVVTLGELTRDEAINETTAHPDMWPGVGRREMEAAADWVLSFYDLGAERARVRAQRDAVRRTRTNPLFAPLDGDTRQ